MSRCKHEKFVFDRHDYCVDCGLSDFEIVNESGRVPITEKKERGVKETEDLLLELLTRLTLAVESIADAIASHAEVFVAANDEEPE